MKDDFNDFPLSDPDNPTPDDEPFYNHQGITRHLGEAFNPQFTRSVLATQNSEIGIALPEGFVLAAGKYQEFLRKHNIENEERAFIKYLIREGNPYHYFFSALALAAPTAGEKNIDTANPDPQALARSYFGPNLWKSFNTQLEHYDELLLATINDKSPKQEIGMIMLLLREGLKEAGILEFFENDRLVIKKEELKDLGTVNKPVFL